MRDCGAQPSVAAAGSAVPRKQGAGETPALQKLMRDGFFPAPSGIGANLQFGEFFFAGWVSRQTGADDQRPDDAEKLRHGYPPRRAVRVSSGEDSWTSPGILACSEADALAGRPDGCGPDRAEAR